MGRDEANLRKFDPHHTSIFKKSSQNLVELKSTPGDYIATPWSFLDNNIVVSFLTIVHKWLILSGCFF